MSEYGTAAYRKARAELLANHPICHWCGKAPATELDHLNEVDNGGTIDDGYVSACKPCNSKRGVEHLNRKRARQTQSRNAAMNQLSHENHEVSLMKVTHSHVNKLFYLLQILSIFLDIQEEFLNTL